MITNEMRTSSGLGSSVLYEQQSVCYLDSLSGNSTSNCNSNLYPRL